MSETQVFKSKCNHFDEKIELLMQKCGLNSASY